VGRQGPMFATLGFALLCGLAPLARSQAHADASSATSAASSQPSATPSEPGILTGYALAAGPLEIAGSTDASGIAFCPPTRTLFVADNGGRVFEIAADARVLRTIELAGFDDPEDIAWLDGDRFAVVEEGRRTFCIVALPAGAARADYAGAASWVVDPVEAGNQGLEGLAVDRSSGTAYATKETWPCRLYAFAVPARKDAPLAVRLPWEGVAGAPKPRDMSAIHHHAASGRLLILSKLSHAILECSTNGQELARHSFRPHAIPKAEGLTMDDEGALYLVSEPNLLYVFKRGAAGLPLAAPPPRPAAAPSPRSPTPQEGR
jgi:uncharacterized protein YjiK